MTTDIQVLAFDIYGTILDTRAIASKIAETTKISTEDANKISQTFRTLQLEYTWRLSLMGLYEPFDEVTKRALEHTLAEHEVQIQPNIINDIMDVYIKRLQPFDGALKALEALSKKSNVKIVVFTNGNHEMVSAALKSASLLDYADGIFLADMIKLYKPAKKIYESLVDYVNSEGGRLEDVSVKSDRVWLVSGNPFDVIGARNAGLQAIWVNPGGPDAWKDRAVDLKPSKVIRNLEELSSLF